ncbi:MAG: hypothetical protein IJK81_09690 [Selenomonadaceae bacterium]|nr:hypothetical protein [Selenomonadaceae bacterium]
MLRILIWQVSNDMTFKDYALKILEYQHDGLEIVGEAVNDDIAKVDRGGIMKSLPSAQEKSA